MFNNVALDVVIGLVFVFLLYSLLGTLIQEIIATNIGLRGLILEMAIRRMLDDDKKNHKQDVKALLKHFKEIKKILDKKNITEENRVELEKNLNDIRNEVNKHVSDGNNKIIGSKLSTIFYEHPLIKYLAADTLLLKKMPSYIDPETFSKVVIDLLRGQNISPGSSDRQPIQKSLDEGKIAWDKDIPIEHETLTYLRSTWADAQGDVNKFKANLEQWFNEMMNRATGWYKKYTQIILMAVGLAIAGAFNVDTIKITGQLSRDPKLREQLIAQATNYTKAHPDIDKEINETNQRIKTEPKPKIKDSLNKVLADDKQSKTFSDELYKKATNLVGKDVSSLNKTLAIGWKGASKENFGFLTIPGWILTALAVSMGAPFWFDLLNKLMQLRSSIAPKEDSKSKPDSSPKQKERVG